MSRLRMLQGWMVVMVLSAGLGVVSGMAAGSTQTFTGKVSDAMCGAKHMEGGLAPAASVRACVQKGTKYALVVGDKVYALETSDQAVLGGKRKYPSRRNPRADDHRNAAFTRLLNRIKHRTRNITETTASNDESLNGVIAE